MGAPDLVTGLVLVGLGLVCGRRRAGVLLVLSGAAWFLADAVWWTVFVHRGLLYFLVLTYPAVRLRPKAALFVPLAVAGCTMVYPLTRLDPVAVGEGLAVAVGAAWRLRTAGVSEFRARATALGAAVLLSGVVTAGALARRSGAVADSTVLWAYELVVVLVACWLSAELLLGGSRDALVRLVVDLGESAGEEGALRARLAVALGDPLLEVGYWHPAQRRYVNESGQPLRLPDAGTGRTVTTLAGDGEPVAVLVHDDSVLYNPALVSAVAAVARIAVDNARLQAELRERLDELQSSRRRIVEAADAERRRLERELDKGVMRRLERVAELLSGAGPGAGEVLGSLDAVRTELREFARGIHPASLVEEGLPGALAELARQCPLKVELAVPDDRFDPAVAAAAYFICAEALSNAVKHATASRVGVRVTRRHGEVLVEVEDDGTGGADPHAVPDFAG